MHPLPEHVQAQEVTDLIVTEIERVLLDLHIEKERVIGVGVAAQDRLILNGKRFATIQG